MLLLRQHEDREDQLSSKNSFDKNALHQARASSKCSPDIQRCREQAKHHSRRSNTSSDLSNEQTHSSHSGQGADENHAQCDCGIEQAAGNAEKDPDIDHDGEAEDDGDEEVDRDIEDSCSSRRGIAC